jgi:hypothetical protein
VLGRARRAFENAQCSLYRTATRRRSSTSEIERARDDRRERRRRRRRRSFPRRFFARRKRSVRRRRALRLRRLRAVPLDSLGREPSEDEHAVRFVRLLQRALEPLVQPRSTLFASTRPLSVRARISRGKVYSDRHASGETEVYEYEHRASFDGRAAYRIEWNRHERRRTQSLNARTEWVKYKNLFHTTCTTAGVFIKSRNNHPSICSSVSFQTQRAS